MKAARGDLKGACWRCKVAGKAVGVRAVCERRADWALHRGRYASFQAGKLLGSICCLCFWLKDKLKFFNREFLHTRILFLPAALVPSSICIITPYVCL